MSYLTQNGTVPVRLTTPLTSSGNSWGYNGTRTLSSGQELIGKAELTPHRDVAISAKVIGGSATLYVDFSMDGGQNYDTILTAVMADGVGEYHVIEKNSRTCRVRLVAGSDDLTAVRIHTEYGQFRQPNAPLNSSIQLDADGASVRPTSFQDEVRIGRRTGITGWTKWGYRTGLTASAGEQMIWTSSENTFTPLTSAETFTIGYTQANDGSSSNGALTLYVQYVDANGLPDIAVHTLGNDGSDVTSFTGLGINRVAVASSGSTNTNGADITFTATTAGTVQAHIPAGGGVTQQCLFHCGANHDGVIKFIRFDAVRASGGSTGLISVRGLVFNRAVETFFEIYRATLNVAITLEKEIQEPIGFNLSPSDILYFVADTGTDNFDIQCRFSLNEYQRT